MIRSTSPIACRLLEAHCRPAGGALRSGANARANRLDHHPCTNSAMHPQPPSHFILKVSSFLTKTRFAHYNIKGLKNQNDGRGGGFRNGIAAPGVTLPAAEYDRY